MDEKLFYWIIGGVALIGVPLLRSLLRLDNGANSFEARRCSGKILDDFDEAQKYVDQYSK